MISFTDGVGDGDRARLILAVALGLYALHVYCFLLRLLCLSRRLVCGLLNFVLVRVALLCYRNKGVGVAGGGVRKAVNPFKDKYIDETLRVGQPRGNFVISGVFSIGKVESDLLIFFTAIGSLLVQIPALGLRSKRGSLVCHFATDFLRHHA